MCQQKKVCVVEVKVDVVQKDAGVKSISNEASPVSTELRVENRSEFSSLSMDCQKAPVLTVLSARDLHGLIFDNLLQVPAELLGKGNHGSVYKVMLNNDVTLAVKRIKDWKFASQEFQKRMCKISRVKHPNVLPPIAFYCSMQEKLLVYEYQQKGSLFQLLHGSRNDREFGWESWLAVAAHVAEALAFMYKELQHNRIAHGNLKSTDILFNDNMDPCISE